MTVLDVWGSVDPRYGGVGPTASAMASAIHCSRGWATSQVAVCQPSEHERAEGISPCAKTIVTTQLRPIAEVVLKKHLRPLVQDSDICHVHGMWTPYTLVARSLARSFDKPLICSVHGMLEKWDLANKKLKKAIYSALVERSSLASSACLRALSQGELSEYRSYGLRNPVAVVPNGIAPLSRVDTGVLTAEFASLRDKQVVLFLGRIHRKKGILRLLEAWPGIVAKRPEAHLLVAGGEFGDTGIIAREMVKSLNIGANVTFCGVLSGAKKFAALSLARWFCLPSFSEGMPISVLEALSIGLPVVVTPSCNVDGVEEANAGIVTSNEPVDLVERLTWGLGLSTSAWDSLSANAQLLARSRYSWPALASTMSSVYEWMTGGPRPSCVIC